MKEKTRYFRVVGKHCNATALEIESNNAFVDYMLLAETLFGRVLLIGDLYRIDTHLQLVAGFLKSQGVNKDGERLDEISSEYQELLMSKADNKEETLLNFRNEIKRILTGLKFSIVDIWEFGNKYHATEHSDSLRDFKESKKPAGELARAELEALSQIAKN